jgi:ABC-type transporter Mla subunit MlaD
MARIDDLIASMPALVASAAAAQSTIASQSARIAELEAKIAEVPLEDPRIGEVADQIAATVATLNQSPPG